MEELLSGLVIVRHHKNVIDVEDSCLPGDEQLYVIANNIQIDLNNFPLFSEKRFCQWMN